MRSLLRQLEQVRNTGDYDDAVTGVYTSAVSEPVVSGTLEGDMNSLRTIVNELKGSTQWFDDLGNYFDPTDTDAVSLEKKDLNLTNIKNNTLDSKTIIIAVTSSGQVVASGTAGVLLPYTTQYATATDRTGLPIFASSGTYYDEGGFDTVCRIDVVNTATDGEFENSAGNIVYAKFEDGADHVGTGDGTDVYAKLYASGIVYTLDENDPTEIKFIYPVRRQMSDMAEHEWLRTDFVNSWEGDYELIEDISNLWGYTGASDNDSSTTGDWTHIASHYILNSDPSSLFTAVNLLNTEIGDRDYGLAGDGYYIDDGESISDSLDKLDAAIYGLSVGAVTKYVEAAPDPGGIPKNTLHTVPGTGYTPHGTSGEEGRHMDVYVDGQLLASSTGANGVNADRDYAESSTTQITFHFNIHKNQNITYMIRQ